MSQSASGWGKKAATRIDRTQFDNDELLKSLGSQFNVDFSNYDQWQRTSRSNKSPAAKTASNADVSTTFTVSRLKSIDSSCAKHSSFREKRQAAKQEELDREEAERIKILELRIRTRRKTYGEYVKRCKELIIENNKLKDLIDADEDNTHGGVKNLLRRYERYRGGIATLNNNFTKELEEALEELSVTKEKIKRHIDILEQELAVMNEKLTAKQDELKVLLSYKDKEYPVKAMKIAGLHTEIDNLKLSNKEDQDELQHIINTEEGKYEKSREQESNEITRNVTDSAVKMMHQSLKDMAFQNMVMEKEILIHSSQEEGLQQRTAKLQAEIDALRGNKTNIRLQMFPEFYVDRPKCTPDMDVILNIPTQELLPI
ncbi:uncharacterized protein C20orf96 [Patella vulgata]|uniref:uncharacterized protein C20orf96 n=1 Tax=Patella vulgata TaxID=6465 RepID=UPI00218096EB|nr:uncharacterized protein C20orf96 [Patella vulgata]